MLGAREPDATADRCYVVDVSEHAPDECARAYSDPAAT
jgi:hypothetical protein